MSEMYIILQADTDTELSRLVTTAIIDGWKPQGGISIAWWHYVNEREGYTETGLCYAQAMVKDAT